MGDKINEIINIPPETRPCHILFHTCSASKTSSATYEPEIEYKKSRVEFPKPDNKTLCWYDGAAIYMDGFKNPQALM